MYEFDVWFIRSASTKHSTHIRPDHWIHVQGSDAALDHHDDQYHRLDNRKKNAQDTVALLDDVNLLFFLAAFLIEQAAAVAGRRRYCGFGLFVGTAKPPSSVRTGGRR